MRATVTRSDIAAALCTRIGISRQEAQELTDAFFDILSNTLERGENISLSSFGAFRLREKGPRAGRNPRTGKPVPIDARRVVTFLSSRTLRARIDRA
ncbi:integration host factor subunit alpha [Paraburkholderia fungorum]